MKHITAPAACWLHDAAEVRSSEIEGRGLFSRTRIAAGTAVVRLGGRLVSGAELRRLFSAAALDANHPYVDCITVARDQHLVIEPGQDVHYGNHGCDPNLWHVGPFSLEARRDIVAGEELTVDYATQTADPEFRLVCSCGATACRGVVTGDDWRLEELRRRYADHWVPAIVALIADSPR